MKKSSLSILAVVASVAATAFFGCNSASEIGGSTVEDGVNVVIDSSFTITGITKPIQRVQSRTIAQLLGSIEAEGYGSISSDVVTQFMPSSQIVTDGVTVNDIDSLVLYLTMTNGDFVGDSITPMGLDVYRLTKLLPSPIYSDFDPEGYYDAASPIASTMYNVARQSNDSTASTQVEVKVKMPLDFGKELFTAYLDNPAAFTSPTAFADQVFKGFYFKNSYGSGRFMRVSNTRMSMYYHRTTKVEDTDRDTVIYEGSNYFAVTPEIITNNDIRMIPAQEVLDRVAAGEAIVQGPVGLEVETVFPAPEIIAAYKMSNKPLSVFNSLTFTLPAEQLQNECDFSMPAYLLLVLTKDKDAFFSENKLPDNVTSFYAEYDTSTGLYDFGDMRAYFVDLLSKDQITEEDYTFTIMPVSTVFETQQVSYYYTQQVLTMVTPYVSAPAIARLRFDKAEIHLTYSGQGAGN